MRPISYDIAHFLNSVRQSVPIQALSLLCHHSRSLFHSVLGQTQGIEVIRMDSTVTICFNPQTQNRKHECRIIPNSPPNHAISPYEQMNLLISVINPD